MASTAPRIVYVRRCEDTYDRICRPSYIVPYDWDPRRTLTRVIANNSTFHGIYPKVEAEHCWVVVFEDSEGWRMSRPYWHLDEAKARSASEPESRVEIRHIIPPFRPIYVTSDN